MYETFSDDELHESAIRNAKLDQRQELISIAHLMEVDKRRLYAKRGFSSIFSYALEGLGYSHSVAATRVNAMKLARTVEMVPSMLESGDLSVSSACAIQRFFRKEDEFHGTGYTPETKAQIVAEVAGKSVREAERILLSYSTDPEPHTLREVERPVSLTRNEMTFYADAKLVAEIERMRELKGRLSLEQVVAFALGMCLSKIDPLRYTCESKSVSSTSNRRYITKSDMRELHVRSGSQCQWVDEKTGRRCISRMELQPDHIIGFAKGGPTELKNLRLCCPPHNKEHAFNTYGEEHMSQFYK